MKKKVFKALAVILSLTMAFSCVTVAFAESSRDDVLKKAKFVDNLLDGILDPVFNGLINILFKAESIGNRYPTADEYLSEESPYFYEGTDGKLTGDGWQMGYASSSVIPLSWRTDADGKQDDEGMNLNKTYFFGGYFGSTVNKIYDDETVNLVVLSAGTDSNNNGVDDIIIIATLDNIGMSNGNIKKIRQAVSEKLSSAGVAPDDIVAFEFGCTHAHTVIEALGMSLDNVFFTALLNHFLFRRDTAVRKELFNTICENTAASALEAYKGMEQGTLSFFETRTLTEFMDENAINKKPEDRQMAFDKLQYGANCQDTIACWYFEGSESGEKTVLANVAMHPTFAGRDSKRVCADYPYYFNRAMQEKGYNLVFLQGSQAAIGVTGYYTQEGSDWATENTVSKDEWVERYGSKYADKHYEEEAAYFTMKATAYSLAQVVEDGISSKQELVPSVDIEMQQAVIPFDYSIMYLAGVSGAFGYNVIRSKGTETGYSLVTEVGYINLGNTAMLTLPGEVSPAITFGRSEKFTGEESWSGEMSWSGEDWNYKTLRDMAQEKLGADTKVYAIGLANDEIGYVMPDSDCAKNFLTKSLTSDMGYNAGRANNEELMAASRYTGSALVKAFAALFDTDAEISSEPGVLR